MGEETLGVALIGAAGGMSRLRGVAVKADPRTRIVSLCEGSKERWPKVEERYGDIPVTEDYEEAIDRDDVDVVAVSTHNASHYEIARFALEHGKHTVVEYPLVLELEHLDDLAAIAREKGLVLAEGLTPVLDCHYWAAKELIDGIGQPLICYYRYHIGKIGWYWKRDVGGDFFIFVHLHQICHLHGWLGEPTEVWAADTIVPCEKGEIHGLPAAFRFKNGAVNDHGRG